MPVAPSDLVLMLSLPNAAGGALGTQPDPNASLGRFVSTTPMSNVPMNNLYDNITGAENAAGTVDFRCIFVQNNHTTLTAMNVAVWIQSQIPGGAVSSIGLDTTAASLKNAVIPQALSIVGETTPPVGVTFVSAATAPNAIIVGNLTPGQVRAIWIKRQALNTAPLNTDGLVLEIDFDTQE